ncbi:MAG: hypothetical protein JWQ44_2772 [Chthoniobacter sp.]|nr:hypothetical protein [Chthoniobacter sp.]
MALLHRGTVGILPAGALGVAFYFHLTHELRRVDERVCFMAREGSSSAAVLREYGRLQIARGGQINEVAHPALWTPDLLTCAESGFLPELVLVCTQPDQLLSVIGDAVRLLEQLSENGHLDAEASQLPMFILSSNGIYFQRVRQFLIEKLEEATLFGRLPDLWPDRMPHIVGKLLRGVTIQTGQREGSGTAAIYRPGASGRTRLAGGNTANRERAAALLSERGGWFEAVAASPTRVEFDKALVNLAVNLLGQLRAIGDDGSFSLLTIREIIQRDDDPEVRQLAEQVVEVGRAVRAYGPADNFAALYEKMLGSAHEHLEHVPSSLQWIAQQLRRGTLEARLSPTEAWLLEPLIRYAKAAGLAEAAHYFEDLTRRVEERLALAAAVQR